MSLQGWGYGGEGLPNPCRPLSPWMQTLIPRWIPSFLLDAEPQSRPLPPDADPIDADPIDADSLSPDADPLPLSVMHVGKSPLVM